MQNPVIRALFEVIDLLETRGIQYAVMGGLAVRALALPRPTNDVDITIALPHVALLELLRFIGGEGIEVPEVYRNGWLDRVAGMPLLKLKTYLDREHFVDLDIFVAESEFQMSLVARRISAEIDERQIWIVTPEDLVLLKLLANRPRDHIDVADILFIQGQLDEDYLKNWASVLEITDRLTAALTIHSN